MDYLAIWAGQTGLAALELLPVLAIILVVELLLPRERHSLKSRLRGIVFLLIMMPATTGIATAFQMLLKHFGATPLVQANSSGLVPHWAWLVIAPILGLMASDFYFYWLHRAEHVFLWRFHRVHHSIRELNVLAAYQHPTEEIWHSFMIALPMTVLIQFGPEGAFFSYLVVRLQARYIHSSARIHFGPLKYLLIDNQFHRIHHSTNPVHFGKNFGGNTPIWDMLFGTAYFPAKEEWPETGLDDFPEPDGVKAYLLAPFSRANPVNPKPDTETSGAS